MNEQDSLNLKSISFNLKRLADLKELEVKLKRIEVMFHENFPQGMLSSRTSSQRAGEEFWEDFQDKDFSWKRK